MSDESKVNEAVIKEEKKANKYSWIIVGICISMLVAIIFSSFYGIFGNEARENLNNPLETEEQLCYLYENSYVLYRNLYNRQNQTNLSFDDLYLDTAEGYEWLLDDKTIDMDSYEFMDKMIEKTVLEEGETDFTLYDEYTQIHSYINRRFAELENSFSQINSTYDYLIQDVDTGEYITNLTATDIDCEEQFIYVSFVFDKNGNVTLSNDIKGNDVTKLRKNASEAIRSKSLYDYTQNMELIQAGYLKVNMPKNCIVTFCISNQAWNEMEDSGVYAISNNSVSVSKFGVYKNNTQCINIYSICMLFVFAAGFLWPAFKTTKPWNRMKICSCMPVEGLLVMAYLMMGVLVLTIYLVMWVNDGSSIDSIAAFLPENIAWWIVYFRNILVLTAFLFVPWYIGICLRALREKGLKNYIKERSVIYRIFPTIKRKFIELYNEVSHFDVTQNAKKIIIKMVVVNGIILFVIGCLPLGGFAVAVIYSVILYFILKKYISDLQKKYSILLKATNEVAEGNLNGTITEDLGVFEPFKPQVVRIQDGFKKAVEDEVKSQRMKSELITNVSHDLKTPLTAIITYINLLKDENITEQQRKEYLDTLERKSLRLKVLIEDLFEVSKANSQNLTLNVMDVDIVNLLKQVSFEMSDKLNENQLDMRMDLPEEKMVLSLDSQKTYRIFENLFGNVAKYALSGTRVYLQCRKIEQEVQIILKNITAQEIQVNAEELTERFVRGDISRNTEGSGLGLAIAKSFTELQGGSFKIDLDGDLFKVTVSFSCDNELVK